MPVRYDVVVLGAGPAGLAAAITLRRHTGLSLLVIDGGDAVRERPGESAPPQLFDLIRKLGLAKDFLDDEHSHYPGNISLWGSDQPVFKDAIFSAIGGPWRLHRQRFDALLTRAAMDRNIDVAWNTAYMGSEVLDHGKTGYQLRFYDRASGQYHQVRARFVIDATGPTARFARERGARRVVDDRLHALACFISTQQQNMTMQAMIEATEQGWWYAARLMGDRAVIMHVTEKSFSQSLLQNDHSGWQTALQQTKLINPKIEFPATGKHTYHAFPVYSSLHQKMQGPGWLATGDAASCYDPVVAQGLYKALHDGIGAGERVTSLLCGSGLEHDTSYESGIKTRYEEYFRYRTALYQQEARWCNSPFWQNRQMKVLS
jgi:flavin-dependent dehydrogenase